MKYDNNGFLVINYEGKEIHVSGEAHPEYRSHRNGCLLTNPDMWIFATGEDDDGNLYGIWWEITEGDSNMDLDDLNINWGYPNDVEELD